MYNRIISYIKNNVLPKLDSLPGDVAGVKDAFSKWKVDWTKARAARLDNLDEKVSTRASAQDVTNVSTKVEGVSTTITALDTKIDKVGVDAAKAASLGGFDYVSDTTTVPKNFASSPALIASVNLPNCKTIEDSAFAGVLSLTKISCPNVVEIKNGAFSSCSNLTTVDFPRCKTVGVQTFSSCRSISDINLPLVEKIEGSAFSDAGEKSQTPITVNLDSLVTVEGSAFLNANIRELHLPNCTTMAKDSLSYIGPIVLVGSEQQHVTDKISLPKLTVLTERALSNTMGKVYDFGSLEEIKSYAMTPWQNKVSGETNCCQKLIIRTNKVCVLSGIGFYHSTPGVDTPPANIYVPDNLVASYKKASNWSKYANRIKPLSTYVEG